MLGPLYVLFFRPYFLYIFCFVVCILREMINPNHGGNLTIPLPTSSSSEDSSVMDKSAVVSRQTTAIQKQKQMQHGTSTVSSEQGESADMKKNFFDVDSKSDAAHDNSGIEGLVRRQWKGRRDFLLAQGQIAVILIVAYCGNNWPYSYPRNDNHNLPMFWITNLALLVATVLTVKHVESKNGVVTLLSRGQTEEWKGWMQWAFIMYHYYRAYPVYNEIRVFVSSYVWMTGFGNFLYFDKRGDYSIQRCVGMWLRINYFPCLLSLFLRVPLELYYVVPLHTAGFFIALFTSLGASKLDHWRGGAGTTIQSIGRFGNHRYVIQTLSLLRSKLRSKWHCNIFSIAVCAVVHVLFYETRAVNSLLWVSKEIHFRFQADKYSVLIGIISGFFWKDFSAALQRVHGDDSSSGGDGGHGEEEQKLLSNDDGANTSTASEKLKMQKKTAIWIQRGGGVALILLWYVSFGHIGDKFEYNPIHPYIFWMPMTGFLMLRNSSKYLTECHSTALEWLGRITLETYVLQFHVFMTANVQHILVLLPGAGKDGNIVMKTLNMLICGYGFVMLAFYARKATVSTQMTVTELVTLLLKRRQSQQGCCSDKNVEASNNSLLGEQEQRQDGKGGDGREIA